MARQPRLDAPGMLHHVMGRGIERSPIFHDDVDRADFLARLAALVSQSFLAVYAWALMPNHFHLLVRTRAQSLSHSMRALLSGYSTWFNRRHDRVGHVFQNRFKSIVCEDEPYFLALVRYIHRNPLGSVIRDEEALASYPFTGHSALLGTVSHPWQDTDAVLSRFGSTLQEARLGYRRFVEGPEPISDLELEGGGLKPQRQAWTPVLRLDKGRERYRSDERILGKREFVTRALQQVHAARTTEWDLAEIVRLVCSHLRVTEEAVRGDGRTRDVSEAREGIAYLWVLRLGRCNRTLARFLGITDSPLRRAAQRGQRNAKRWDGLLEKPRAVGQGQ